MRNLIIWKMGYLENLNELIEEWFSSIKGIYECGLI